MADKESGGFFERNKAWLATGEHVYNTELGEKESEFQKWVKTNKVPFDMAAPVTDYDMRGFWQALEAKDPRAVSAIASTDNQLHYPDYWKTPYHESFSVESQWANPKKAPIWNELDQLVLPDGTVVYDERAVQLEKIKIKNETNKAKFRELRK